MGCNIGAVGFGLLQLRLAKAITLCELNQGDLDSAMAVYQRFNLARFEKPNGEATQFVHANILEHLKSTSDSYELILSFALFHHLLSQKPLPDILTLIANRCRRTLVVEVPLAGDVLLANVIKKSATPDRFNCLASAETFESAILAALPACVILMSAPVLYGVTFSGLKRHVFVCDLSSRS
jgi:hypothetical protein